MDRKEQGHSRTLRGGNDAGGMWGDSYCIRTLPARRRALRSIPAGLPGETR